MSVSQYMPKDEAGQQNWLNNFSAKLPNYAATLGVPAATVTQIINDAKNLALMGQTAENFKQYCVGLTAFKTILKSGNPNGQAIGTLAAAPTLPVFTALQGDIFGRISKLVATIKASANYTEAIGEDLGIVASSGSFSKAAENALKPNLKIELIGGKPNIIWKKGQTGGIKIMADHGTGNFVFLAVDTSPDYLDKTTLPPMGQAQLWRYMARYIKNDEEIGDWSDIVQITVTGVPS